MDILEEAFVATRGARQSDYGDPKENMRHIAKIASAITKRELTAQDVAMVMIAVKLSREMNKHKRDNLTDLAGYAWVLSKVEGDR